MEYKDLEEYRYGSMKGLIVAVKGLMQGDTEAI